MPVRGHADIPHLVLLCEVIDLGTASRVTGELTRALRRCSSSVLVINLHAAVLTTTGVDVLEHIWREGAERGISVRIVATAPLVHRVLQLAGTDQRIEVHTDLFSAVHA